MLRELPLILREAAHSQYFYLAIRASLNRLSGHHVDRYSETVVIIAVGEVYSLNGPLEGDGVLCRAPLETVVRQSCLSSGLHF